MASVWTPFPRIFPATAAAAMDAAVSWERANKRAAVSGWVAGNHSRTCQCLAIWYTYRPRFVIKGGREHADVSTKDWGGGDDDGDIAGIFDEEDVVGSFMLLWIKKVTPGPSYNRLGGLAACNLN